MKEKTSPELNAPDILEIKLAQVPPNWEKWAKAAIVAGSALLLALAFYSGIFPKFFRLLPDTATANLWVWALGVYGLIHYAALVWRVCLWLGYRPMPEAEESELPSISVIIPAYNEGPLVRQAIQSAASSDYPREKLQIIAVDDGSSDDTWSHIRAAAAQAPLKVLTLRQTYNRGKRHALYAGFQKATGEFWVTVDSDSVLHPRALRNGVTPLLRDRRIGLVAGNVKVLNRNDSLFTRFLKVSFVLSFAFSRAYQTRIRGLLTTPGALTFYRASAVVPVLDKWMNQRFLGVPCLTGEDRSMTNLICAQGHHSFFQSTAVVWAKMPSTYGGMARMFLRWARSNIRETIVLLSYLFRPFRKDYLWGFRLNSVLIASTLIVPYFFIAKSYYLLLTNPLWGLRYLMIVVIMSIPMALIYIRNEGDSDFAWVVAYECFWILACQWIMPYAFLTCRQQGAWITRGAGRKVRRRRPVYGFKGGGLSPQPTRAAVARMMSGREG
ncbi:MAG TPA: glycosyltransferase [Thermodesulfobacteriota bacterium]|nr:glycosyltransferase [Thermodesulfobacteriota bacterium]